MSSEYCCFELGRLEESSEESETKVNSVSEEKIEELAASVMDAVHDGILGKIMKCAVSHAMDVVLEERGGEAGG